MFVTSTTRNTSPTGHVRPPSFRHCRSVRLEQPPGSSLQPEYHQSCFQTVAESISIRTKGFTDTAIDTLISTMTLYRSFKCLTCFNRKEIIIFIVTNCGWLRSCSVWQLAFLTEPRKPMSTASPSYFRRSRSERHRTLSTWSLLRVCVDRHSRYPLILWARWQWRLRMTFISRVHYVAVDITQLRWKLPQISQVG